MRRLLGLLAFAVLVTACGPTAHTHMHGMPAGSISPSSAAIDGGPSSAQPVPQSTPPGFGANLTGVPSCGKLVGRPVVAVTSRR
jgi:hypothetical protein